MSGSAATARLRFKLEPSGTDVFLEPEVLIVAGYTGRDQAEVLAHIRELAEHGIEPPAAVPTFYPLSPALLVQSDSLVTASEETSGEAEVALLVAGGEVYVTVASDHTDRAAERIDVALSKAMCHKVLAESAWELSDVVDHWDNLRLRSWIGDGDLYQDGSTEALLSPGDILDAIPWRSRAQSFVVLCGTVPAIGGLRVGNAFRAELSDRHTGAALALQYRIDVRSFLAPPDATPQPDEASGAERVGAAAQSFGVEMSSDRVAQIGARLEALEQRLLG
ncbi:MAG: DUF2848 family protein [Acidimicrobiales bacterium]